MRDFPLYRFIAFNASPYFSWQLLWLDSLFGLYDLLDLYRPGEGCPSPGRFQFYGQASRPISTGKLNTLL